MILRQKRKNKTACNKNYLISIRIRPNNTKVIHKNVHLHLRHLWRHSLLRHLFQLNTASSNSVRFSMANIYLILYSELPMIQYMIIHFIQHTVKYSKGGKNGKCLPEATRNAECICPRNSSCRDTLNSQLISLIPQTAYVCVMVHTYCTGIKTDV